MELVCMAGVVSEVFVEAVPGLPDHEVVDGSYVVAHGRVRVGTLHHCHELVESSNQDV